MAFDWLELDPAHSGEAVEDKGRPTRVRPTDGPTTLAAARELRHAGFVKSSIPYYAKATALQVHQHNAWVEYLDTLVRIKALDSAEKLVQERVEQYGQVRVFYAVSALIQAHRGNFKEAMKYSDVSLEGQTGYYGTCVRAEILLRAKVSSRTHRRDALEILETCIASSNDPWEPLVLGGCMLLDAGWFAHAAGFFTEAAHKEPTRALAWVCLADSFYALRLYEQAVFYYEQAKGLEPLLQPAIQGKIRSVRYVFGLMETFNKETLEERWTKAVKNHLPKEWEPTFNDDRIR